MADARREQERAEEKMLDDIESNTSRMYMHSLRLQDLATHQTQDVGAIDVAMTASREALKVETANIHKARKMRQGLGWMLGILTAELLLTGLLLYVGLVG